MAKATYKAAGVDLDVYRESMSRLPPYLSRTFSPRVIPQPGGFAGLFRLDFDNPAFARNYEDPVLVSCSDGVGTKLKVAQRVGRHDTIGIDLVAMSVNDAICMGAEPLFFLDYVAMSRDDPNRLEQIVAGISAGCVDAGCALLGGETAIMPDLYQDDDYDLAGFCVGVVERRQLIDGKAIREGDVVLGVASSGLHSNGYSLARKVVFELAGLGPDDPVEQLGGVTVGDALLEPTRIYARLVRRLVRHNDATSIHGLAHITGGGLQENLTRILPDHLRAKIPSKSWPVPPLFTWLQSLGEIEPAEMRRVFNMGIGLTVVVGRDKAESAAHTIQEAGFDCWRIGDVIAAN